jgi:hypothetical protein
MPGERRNPAVNDLPTTWGGKGEMIKAPIRLQDLRRKIYLKGKADNARWVYPVASVGTGGVKAWFFIGPESAAKLIGLISHRQIPNFFL